MRKLYLLHVNKYELGRGDMTSAWFKLRLPNLKTGKQDQHAWWQRSIELQDLVSKSWQCEDPVTDPCEKWSAFYIWRFSVDAQKLMAWSSFVALFYLNNTFGVLSTLINEERNNLMLNSKQQNCHLTFLLKHPDFLYISFLMTSKKALHLWDILVYWVVSCGIPI